MEKKEESYFDLQVDAPFFKELHDLYSSKENNWWQQILNDKELCVNVRAGNCIDVYYHGAGIVSKLEYVDNDFTCKIHKKFLHKENPMRDRAIIVKTNSKGDIVIINREEPTGFKTVKGVDKINEEIVGQISTIKKNIENHYNKKNYVVQSEKSKKMGEVKKPPEEGMSEKEIQGDMYINPEKYEHQRYIDTEFVFVYDKKFKEVTNKKGEKKQISLRIRIDFVTITNDGLIEFVELKRISDPRLITEKYKKNPRKKLIDRVKNPLSLEPEIGTQMKEYTKFIKAYKNEIEKYYKAVQKIMRNIGVNNPLAYKEIKGVVPKARLLFAGYSDDIEITQDKLDHIEEIRDYLKSKDIKSNIEEKLAESKRKQRKK